MKRKLLIGALLLAATLQLSLPVFAGGGYYTDPTHGVNEQNKDDIPLETAGGYAKSPYIHSDEPSVAAQTEGKTPYVPEDKAVETGKRAEQADEHTAALSDEETLTDEEIYAQQYQASGVEELEEALPEDARQVLIEYEITPENPDSITSLTASGVFSMIWNMVKDSYTAPLRAAVAAIAVIFLVCVMESFSGSFAGKSIGGVFQFVSTAAIGAIFILPVMDCVTRSVSAVRVCGIFMLTFCPIYAGILIVSGKAATGLGFQSLVFGASQIVTQIASNFVTPVISMYMGVSVASAVSPGVNINGFCEAFKKIVTWVLTICMTIFVGLLGVQTTINAAADSAANKTAKFFIGTFVPVVGSSIGEALGSVQGCMSILKSSVGIYAVISIFIILIPVVLEILLYKVCIVGCIAVADMFGTKNISALLKSVTAALSLLLAVIACCAVLFIVSLAIVIAAKGGAG